MEKPKQVELLYTVSYRPWALRGYVGLVWQVYVEIYDSHTIKNLIEIKHKLNSGEVKGLVLVENKSPAIKRLGWKQLDEGLYYKYFE